MNEIEIPTWNIYQFTEENDDDEEIDECLDDEMYAKLHIPFEERERRRYVLSTLNGEKPFLLGFSSVQFMKIESKEELQSTYQYPLPKQLIRNESNLEKISLLHWTVSQDQTNPFCLHFHSSQE